MDIGLNPARREAARPASGPRRPGAALLLLILVFVGLHLPVLPMTSRYHADEQYYTDAALHMMRSGDLLTPTYPDGTPFYEKPALTHWTVLAGFKLFGVSFFASRILFLLAGGGVIWLTWLIARALFRSEAAAFAAAVVAFSNNELYGAALRANPDVLLALFLAVSALGFAHLLFGGRRRARDPWMAYVGAGLAVATKGLLPVVFVLFVWAFAYLRRRRAGDLRRLLDAKSLLAGAILGGSWFAAMVGLHGSEALRVFLGDQVGVRLGASAARILVNAWMYVVVLVKDFLPWSLLVLPVLLVSRRTLGRFWTAHRGPIVFTFAWYLVLFVIFASANLFRPRYFLPAYPLVAAVLGAFLVEALAETPVRRFLGRLKAWFPAAGVAAGALAAMIGAFLDPRILVAGLVWIAAALVLYALASKRSDPVRLGAVGLYMLVLYGGYDVLIRPVFAVSPAPALALGLRSVPPGEDVASVGLNDQVLSQIRVLTGGRVWPVNRDGDAEPTRGRPVLLLGQAARDSLPLAGYEVAETGRAFHKIRAGEIWGVMVGGDRSALLDRKTRRFYLAVPGAKAVPYIR